MHLCRKLSVQRLIKCDRHQPVPIFSIHHGLLEVRGIKNLEDVNFLLHPYIKRKRDTFGSTLYMNSNQVHPYISYKSNSERLSSSVSQGLAPKVLSQIWSHIYFTIFTWRPYHTCWFSPFRHQTIQQWISDVTFSGHMFSTVLGC